MPAFISSLFKGGSLIPYAIGTILILFSYGLGKKEGVLQETKRREAILVESTLQWQASLDAEQSRVSTAQKELYAKYRKKGDILDGKVKVLTEVFKEVPFMSDTTCYPSESILLELEALHTLTTKLKGPNPPSPATQMP